VALAFAAVASAAEASAAVAFAAVASAAIGSASLAGLTIPSFTIPMATIPTGTIPTGTILMAITLTDTVMDTVAFAAVAFAAVAFVAVASAAVAFAAVASAAVGDPYNQPVYRGSAGYTDQLVGQIQLRLARTALPHLLEVPAGLNPADLRTIHVGSTAQRSALPKTRRVSRTGIAEQITRWDRAYRLCSPELQPPKEAGLKGRNAALDERLTFPLLHWSHRSPSHKRQGNRMQGCTDALPNESGTIGASVADCLPATMLQFRRDS
jgi:hypothetical protein